MGLLSSLLKQVEVSLHTGDGRWRARVSEVVDALLSRQLLQVRSTSTQVGVTSGTDLSFNTVVEQRGIPYDVATGVATLTAGKTYRLAFHATFVNFTVPATNSLSVEWVHAVTEVALEQGLRAIFIPVTSTANTSAPGKTTVYYTPATSHGVKLRCTSSGGSADMLSNSAQAEILEV